MNAAARWGRRLGLCLLLVALPLLAAADGPENDLERNTQLLLRWKQDGAHYKRLQNDYVAFRALPPERQAQLRNLDRDLHALDAKEQKHLLLVLERYHAFLERLPDGDRQRLLAAHGKERLALVAELQQKQWYDRLPFKVRADLAALPNETQRGAAMTKLREEERRRKRLLSFATRKGPDPWSKIETKERPARLLQYPPEIVEYVFTRIKPRLSLEEHTRLDAAEGKVATLATLLVDYSIKYPVLPPPPGKEGATELRDLPAQFHRLKGEKMIGLKNKAAQERYRREVEPHRKQWPDFALAMVKLIGEEKSLEKISTPPFGACRPGDFSAEVQAAIKKLSAADQKTLSGLEGKWPSYPLKLHELARKAQVPLPGLTLPGTKAYWAGLMREK